MHSVVQFFCTFISTRIAPLRYADDVGVMFPSSPKKVDASLQPNEDLSMTKKTKNKYSHYTDDFRREVVNR